jgi:hypothetical protein
MTDGPTQNGLFRLLDGVPAHAMVIIGLVGSLAAPLIPNCANAKREAAEAELEKAKALRELDLKEYTEDQEKKEAAKAAGADVAMPVPPPDNASPEDPDKAKKAFEDSLDAKYDLAGHERDVAAARAAAAGVRSHLYVHWVGRVLLILGLLIMTLGATGTRQKVLVAVLLIVLFGSLTGVALDVGARASLGGGGS